MSGKVKVFENGKGPGTGYGWITMSDGKDIFVHISNVLARPRELHQNDEVTFEIGKSEKGIRAVDVLVTKRATATYPQRRD